MKVKNKEGVLSRSTPKMVDTPSTAKRFTAIPNILARQTLLSNTGLNSQPAFQVGVDWLDFTFRNIPSHQVARALVAALDRITGDESELSPARPIFNGRLWDGSGEGINGTRIFFDQGGEDTDGILRPIQLKIALPGRIMASTELKTLAKWLLLVGAKYDLDCQRIDLCLDDRDESVKLWKIAGAYKRGNFFNAKYGGIDLSGARGEDKGMSVYFGSPKSLKRLNAYNMGIESRGKIKGIRWESRFRKEAANIVLVSVLECLDESYERFIKYAVDTILGTIDFRNRSSGDPNRFRCPVIDWYADFIAKLNSSPIRIRVAPPVISMQKAIDWIDKSVAQSLSMAREVLDDSFMPWLENVIHSGGERLSNVKRKIIEKTDKQQLFYDAIPISIYEKQQQL